MRLLASLWERLVEKNRDRFGVIPAGCHNPLKPFSLMDAQQKINTTMFRLTSDFANVYRGYSHLAGETSEKRFSRQKIAGRQHFVGMQHDACENLL